MILLEKISEFQTNKIEDTNAVGSTHNPDGAYATKFDEAILGGLRWQNLHTPINFNLCLKFLFCNPINQKFARVFLLFPYCFVLQILQS